MSTLYAQHFRLKEAPFSIAPNPRFLFMSEQHREALAHLLYGIGHDGGFVLLTGEVGTGKTTLCRCLLENVPGDTDVAFIINPRLSVVDLLANICDELGIRYDADKLNNRLLVDAINRYLLTRYAEGRKTVLIIDEAQNLDVDVLEQLRLLTNLETDERKLLQIILLGQPELQDKLAREELRQLAQRITARYHLTALSRTDMQAYIGHRLAVAGCEKAIFSPGALLFVHRQSKGIPRLINLICDRAMLGAFAGGVGRINQGMTRKAAREVLGEQTLNGHSGRRTGLMRTAFLALLLGLSLWTYTTQWQTAQTEIAPSPQGVPVAEVPPLVQEPPAVQVEKTAAAAPAVDAEPEPAPAPAFSDSIFLQDRQTAFGNLFSVWGQTLPEQAEPCAYAESVGLACLRQTGDIGLLRSLNRPAVLEWQRDHGGIAHITVIALSGATAVALAGDIRIEVPLEQLRQHWLDRFTLLWRTPLAYQSDILPGTAGPSARWLNSRIAALDRPAGSMDAAQSPGTYQGEWVQRLRRFQRDAGLFPDGVAGPKTLIRLNTESHEDGPRLMAGPSETPADALQQAATR